MNTMNGTGIGTSLVLIALGAVLAIAVDYQVTGIDINAVGVILIVIGIIGLLMSLLFLGGFGSRAAPVSHMDGPAVESHTTREVVREVPPVAEETTTRRVRRD